MMNVINEHKLREGIFQTNIQSFTKHEKNYLKTQDISGAVLHFFAKILIISFIKQELGDGISLVKTKFIINRDIFFKIILPNNNRTSFIFC